MTGITGSFGSFASGNVSEPIQGFMADIASVADGIKNTLTVGMGAKPDTFDIG